MEILTTFFQFGGVGAVVVIAAWIYTYFSGKKKDREDMLFDTLQKEKQEKIKDIEEKQNDVIQDIEEKEDAAVKQEEKIKNKVDNISTNVEDTTDNTIEETHNTIVDKWKNL